MVNQGPLHVGELQAVSRALSLLTLLAQAKQPLRVTEISRHLGIAPSTAHRMLSTLIANGFALQTSTRLYRRGPALLHLIGNPLAVPMRLREVAHPVLAELAERTGETAHLAVLDGFDVVAIDHVDGSSPIIVRHPIGSRLPSHATAVGQAILAFVPEAAEAVMSQTLEPLTTHTVIERRALTRTLDAVRRRGFAINIRGWSVDTAGVAAPIFGEHAEAIGAIGVSGPVRRIGRQAALLELASAVVEAARGVTEQGLGPRPTDHP